MFFVAVLSLSLSIFNSLFLFFVISFVALSFFLFLPWPKNQTSLGGCFVLVSSFLIFFYCHQLHTKSENDYSGKLQSIEGVIDDIEWRRDFKTRLTVKNIKRNYPFASDLQGRIQF